MPLFMDIHHIESIPFTEEDAYRAHLRDLAVQNKYGLVYKKYYLNIEQRTICCLMQGPSKESCVASHQESQGIGPCNLVEVSPETEFYPYLGEGSKNDKDLALTLSGEVDTGYRTLMQINTTSFGKNTERVFADIARYVTDYDGNVVERPEPAVLASFIKPQKAISCAVILRDYLRAIFDPALFTIAVVTGKPIDKKGNRLFEDTLNRLTTLKYMGQNGKVTADEASETSYRRFSHMKYSLQHVNVLSRDNEILLRSLYDSVHLNLDNTGFKTEHLQDVVGASKAQAYRKIKGLTGLSPNEFIREVRLRRSVEALSKNGKTVAEIAYAHGFSSPTYFTRVFKERFGHLPTAIVKQYFA
ncbi:helix-turn-helix domain-containing protein [Pareuzebyella sediminis]|uniref:helix-turn-helix domain-containing protein n=1 Tax=Pareuzebyella sediminis TaxID=2607998 RepID=UPI0011EBA6AB|nr:AraC family transcriptional regulator [Pareuzebyella sediminis]